MIPSREGRRLNLIARTLRPGDVDGNGEITRKNRGRNADHPREASSGADMPNWLLAFIVLDLVITAIVVALFVSGRLKLNVKIDGAVSSVNFRELMEFSKDKHARVGEYLRANWSGAPEQLPGMLGTLLAELERDAQARGMTVDRDLLKSMLASSVRQHHLTRGKDLEQAMKQVA
jgi:hypothetical protein